jgi:hypothetical protein
MPDAIGVGIFSGAGISSGPPACLPLGRTFHRLLRDACETAARALAPDVVDDRVIAAARPGSLNVLARIENTLPGAGRGALRAMRVDVPNEEHLLAAIHLARGGYHVTVNFDDGVEVAYALLAGERALLGASAETERLLQAWRRQFPSSPRPLQVVSRPAELGARHMQARPLLVKLHGSLGEHADGVALSLRGVTDEPEVVDLGRARLAAMAELAGHPFILVTGFSGGDLASTTPVLDCLRRKAFAWVAPEVRPAVRSALEAIDPSQPRFGFAAHALREILGVDAPPWRNAAQTPTFEHRFGMWLATLPPTVGAEAFAWSLADAGLLDEAVELLDRIARADRRARTRLRLADALSRRAGPDDRRAARRHLWRLIATGDGDLRRCAAVRWAEHGIGRDPSRRRMRPAVGAAVAALSIAAAWRGSPAARTRSAAARAAAVLNELESELGWTRDDPTRRRDMRAAAVRVLRTVRGALAHSADAPSGRRRAELRRQAIELRAILAILRRRRLSQSPLIVLDELAGCFAHVSDTRGLADTLATRALVVACQGDRRAAKASLAEATRLGATPALCSMVTAVIAASAAVRGGQPGGTWRDSPGSSSPTSSSTSSSVPSSTSSSTP